VPQRPARRACRASQLLDRHSMRSTVEVDAASRSSGRLRLGRRRSSNQPSPSAERR
jgi:hypothetical protein